MSSVHDSVTLTPKQFEKEVKKIIQTLGAHLTAFEVQNLKKLEEHDGTYEIDVAARFEALGGEYLTLIECKHHKNPIKREAVQVLWAKIQSTSAQKGMIFATTDFQKGAVNYALKHRIALVKIADGRTAYITKGMGKSQLPPGFPPYVGWMTIRYEGSEAASALVCRSNSDLLATWLGVEQGLV
jgi:restriction system protein